MPSPQSGTEPLLQAIAQMEAMAHRGAAQLTQLATLHEQLSAAFEQAGDFAQALRHHQLFHRFSMQALAPEVLPRERLLPQLTELLQRPDRIGSGLCLVALSMDAPAGGSSSTQSLARLGELLRLQCRPDDLLAQLERGDGLLLALPNVDLASARKVCERVRAAWATQHGGTLSMGLSAWRGPIDELLRWVERAENGLAAAQHSGGNCLRSGAA
ncbi:hypothetical protein WG899_18780 [Paucibacter sp. AS339]|uniref:hypothetical protein n=1 Tax=Paucibacter hankyongi TaxID=3133434 RepID=UPI0030B63EA6